MGRLVLVGIWILLAVSALALIDFIVYEPEESPLREGIRSVRSAIVPDRPAPEPAGAKASDKSKVALPQRPRPAAGSQAPGKTSPDAATPGGTASATPAPPPTPAVEPSDAAGRAAPAPPPVRLGEFYLPGSEQRWARTGIAVDTPVIVRAGGQVRLGADVSGPSGLINSAFEKGLSRRPADADRNARALPAAPQFALVGRVCSSQSCSSPFVLGGGALVCPGALGITGELQVWTNNYTRLDGTQTNSIYSKVLGGFSVRSETAPAEACSGASSVVALGAAGSKLDATALGAGQVLKKPEFVVTSGQTAWKPFFLPLDRPLLIRATGQMQPQGGATPTGPDGIRVSTASRWVYPGAPGVIVDAEHTLSEPSMAYQALIGRFCGTAECDRPFLIGSERALCPAAPYDNRLELWINHVFNQRALADRSSSVLLDALQLQSRRGEYRFEISRAPDAACGR